MNKMRDRMPLIIIILIIAFLATIVFEWGMEYMGMDQGGNVFAEVNGQEITAVEFEQAVQQRVEQMRANNPAQEIDDATMEQIRTSTWDELVQNVLLNQEMEKLGITVNDQEVLDWIYQRPETLPENIRQYFMDSTGVFNYESYQAALASKEPQVVQFWAQVEQGLRRTLQLQKLQNVITASVLVTEQEVLQKYKDDNIKVNFELLSLPISSVTDPGVNNVTEEQMRAYYEANKSDFIQQEAVRFKYVVVPEVPSAQDSTDTENRIKALLNEFKTLDPADSAFIQFVNTNSETKYIGEFQKPNAIRSAAIDFLMSAETGAVSDVLKDEDGFKIVKLIESKDGTDEYVKASHILVNFGTDSAAAKLKADEFLKKVKEGADFGDLAFQLSEDPSAKTNRGNLGWFTKGAMVKEFEEAAFNNPVGSLVGPIKTQFGYHIIKVENKTNKEFKFSEIKESIVPGSTTKEITKVKAEEIFNKVKEGQTLDTVAYEYKLTVAPTGDVLRNGTIPMIPGNTSVVKFGFDNEVGAAHSPVKTQGGYAVLQLTEKLPAGFKNFDEIKATMIQPRVIAENKFAYLKPKAEALAPQVQSGNFTALAEQNKELTVQTIDSMSFAAPSPMLGMDYPLMNAIFSMEQGQISGPIKGQQGYYFVKLLQKTPFNEQDYLSQAAMLRSTMMQQKQQTVVQSWLANLKERADITDNRDLYL